MKNESFQFVAIIIEIDKIKLKDKKFDFVLILISYLITQKLSSCLKPNWKAKLGETRWSGWRLHSLSKPPIRTEIDTFKNGKKKTKSYISFTFTYLNIPTEETASGPAMEVKTIYMKLTTFGENIQGRNQEKNS